MLQGFLKVPPQFNLLLVLFQTNFVTNGAKLYTNQTKHSFFDGWMQNMHIQGNKISMPLDLINLHGVVCSRVSREGGSHSAGNAQCSIGTSSAL